MSAAVAAIETGDATSSSSRRKSGRVTKKPEKFTSGTSPTGTSKRKRGDGDDSGVDADGVTSEEEDESSESEPDEEELRERRRKSKGKAPAKRSAPKKAKTNGKSVTLAMRPASAPKKSSRPRKAPIRKSILAGDETEGLYGRRDALAETDITDALQPTCLLAVIASRMLRRVGWRDSTNTKRKLLPRL